MAVTKITYDTYNTITIGLATTPLASSATFVAGRQGTAVDNTTNLYDDALVSGQVTVGTTPTANTQIQVYVYAQQDDTPTYPDTFTGTDGDKTITSAGVASGMIRLAGVLSVDATTSNRTYYLAPFSVASLFGGVLPKRWGLFITHNTGVALNSTAANHVWKYVGITYTTA